MYGILHKKLSELSRAASPGFTAAASRVVFAPVATACEQRFVKYGFIAQYGFVVTSKYLVGFANYLNRESPTCVAQL